MRLTSVALFVALAATVSAVSPSPSPSSRPPCAIVCAAEDLKFSSLESVDRGLHATICIYESGGTCTYDSTGALLHDNNANACAETAHRRCAPKKFNILFELAERRKNLAAARPQTSRPDITSLRRRAALKRSRAT
ncbi:hypothetical protein AURDEDRAFT_144936 [Auricularia subglabra TFB-10046 SS5]|nr:hypothetical protein AURDEDRAFT_144936 [Auricularia subglabra TFB-10046 SS5]